jgi:hypothetical protein
MKKGPQKGAKGRQDGVKIDPKIMFFEGGPQGSQNGAKLMEI